MHPEQHYIQDHIDLYEHIDDPAYLAKEETFESWYENPIDLPGRWYLQVISQLFKENRLAKGEFVGLGRRLDLRTSPARSICWLAPRTTSRPRSRYSTQPIISARRRTGSSKRRCQADILACSWGPRR